MKEITQEEFKISLPLQIRFSDIDALGHINNNIYFSYFDLGKVNYLQTIKATTVDWLEVMMVLAHVEIDYYSSVYYRESIVVESKIIRLGHKSGTFLQQIRNADTNEIKCRCESIFVSYDPNTQSSSILPEIWKEAISRFEGLSL